MKQQDRILTRYLCNRSFSENRVPSFNVLQSSTPSVEQFDFSIFLTLVLSILAFFFFSSPPGSSPFLHDGYSSTSSNGRIFVPKQVERVKGKEFFFFSSSFFFFYSFHSIDPSFRTKRLIPVDPICSYSILFHV